MAIRAQSVGPEGPPTRAGPVTRPAALSWDWTPRHAA
ncbi:DUF6053 domain-containing protein [Lysobacter sp. CA199]